MAQLPIGESDQHTAQGVRVRIDDPGQIPVSVCGRTKTHGHLRVCFTVPDKVKGTDQRYWYIGLKLLYIDSNSSIVYIHVL